jgi:prepilin-type N-terminal cleavage/methylation domain-containing protein
MRRRKRGFTLVELLVALAISSVLVLLLVNVVSAALNAWQQGRNQIDTFANARQALGRIADEIKGATASPAPNAIEFSENVPSLQPSPASQQGVSEFVFFVAPYPNSASGDLCVIAYRHNSTTHELQRAFVDSLSAWNGSPKYQSGGYPTLLTAAQWRTVAKGVLEFELQSYSQTDLDSNTTPTPTPANWNSIGGASTMLGNTPRQVVIRIKVVDDKTLPKLVGLSAGNATYDRLVLQAAREFSASVLLPPAH